jgi:transcriptional regulator with XRE-family HTH domain
LRDVETGKSQPTIDVLEKICAALDITLAEFFAEDDCTKVAESPCGYGDYADLPKEAIERVEELIALYRMKYKTEKDAKK